MGLDSRRRAVTASATEGLWREGDHWALRYRGREARVRHAKGLGYLAVLLEHPGAEIHVLELAGRRERAAGSRAIRRRASRAARRTTRAVRARRWTRRPRRPIGRASTSCARSSNRPATGRMTSARRGPRRSSTSSPASWPARSASAAATGPPPPRPSARARTSGAGCTRPCARSPRRCPSSAGISSARSTRARRARIDPTPSRRSPCCSRRQRAAAGDGGDHAHRRRGHHAAFARHRRRRPSRRRGLTCRGAPRGAPRRGRLDLRGVRACLGRAGLRARSPAERREAGLRIALHAGEVDPRPRP